jgi:sigma-E factor negative regulatory protein RseA
MSEKTREHISSLMDGEIDAESSRFLLRRLGSDEELCATWARYHLVRDCLRHGEGGLYGRDLCQRVNRVLEREPAVPGGAGRALRWLRPVAGGAIAAGVALMAVLLVDPGRPQAPGAPAAVAQSQPAAGFVTPNGLNGLPASRAASLASSPASGTRINHYLLRHYQATGGNNARGLVTFVPVMVQRRAAPEPEAVPAAADPRARSDERQ